MLYNDLYCELKSYFDHKEKNIMVDRLSLKIKELKFQSPGFNSRFTESFNHLNNQSNKSDLFSHDQEFGLNSINDHSFESNRTFNYYVFESTEIKASSGIIFLFHGLNERKWDKYLPWAYELARQTGKKVILLPIAFHMNRAPCSWSDPRLMKRVAENRLAKDTNSHSSFANAAISERLESLPQRFFLSGLQTYNDFCCLIKQIRTGQIEDIPAEAEIDIFGYSIGAFFSLLLMLDNPCSFLTNSRLFIFCGGATYDRSFPISKFIIDKRASNSVTSFFDLFFDNKTVAEEIITNHFEDLSLQQSFFCSLMNYDKFRESRENRLTNISERINAFVLPKDDVIPPDEVSNTLKGKNRNINTHIIVKDFDFPYTHITPFPLIDEHKIKIDYSFKELFSSASAFLI
jgi:hypothetical protein